MNVPVRPPQSPSGSSSRDVAETVLRALMTAESPRAPFPHWLLRDILPASVAAGVTALPFDPPAFGDTLGRRETHNSTRVFFNPEVSARYPVARFLIDAFQDPEIILCLNGACGIDLSGTHLRIEYCQDVEGFWLEPHTDIRVKKLTFLIYLSAGPEAEDWGTDIYDADARLVGRADGRFNRGLIFVPADDTWHGFAPRPIKGIRRSLIVNYVGADWRATDELADPNRVI